MGAPGFVTSHLRGLSALFTRWSYCPPCSQWENSEDHSVYQRMANRTWEQRLNRAGIILPGEEKAGDAIWVEEASLAAGYNVINADSCLALSSRRKGVGDNECQLQWEKFV